MDEHHLPPMSPGLAADLVEMYGSVLQACEAEGCSRTTLHRHYKVAISAGLARPLKRGRPSYAEIDRRAS